jgi:hypothetical protein
MNTNKSKVMAMMNCDMSANFNINDKSLTHAFGSDEIKTDALYREVNIENNLGSHQAQPLTGWSFFQNYYYPYVIRESYPVYIQERALDKGKQAFEIMKVLQDKKLLNIVKVVDFIDAMDALIKIL